MIQSIAFITYAVSDLPAARRFYEGTLGLRLTHEAGGEWFEYDIGDTTFAITGIDMQHTPGAKGAVVAFEVSDLDAFVKRLKEQGVAFVLDVTETPVCRMAVIADPDGNHIIIHK